MSDNSDFTPPMIWTEEALKRLRALWMAWYKVSRIAEIFGCSPAAINRQAYKHKFPFRPLDQFFGRHRVPELEIWPPVGRNLPSTFVVPKYLRLTARPTRASPALICLPSASSSLWQVDAVTLSEFLATLPPLVEEKPTPRPAPPVKPVKTPRPQAVKTPWLQPASEPAPTPPRQQAVKRSPAKAKVEAPKPMPPSRPAGFYKTGKTRITRDTRVFDETEDRAMIDKFLQDKGATKVPFGQGAMQELKYGEKRSWEERRAEARRITEGWNRWKRFREEQAAIRQKP